MHGMPDGTKARKESGTKVFNEQSIFSNQNELSDVLFDEKSLTRL